MGVYQESFASSFFLKGLNLIRNASAVTPLRIALHGTEPSPEVHELQSRTSRDTFVTHVVGSPRRSGCP